MHLLFEEFALEKGSSGGLCYDYVSVYDGWDDKAERVSHACGDDIPGDITSSRNTLYVVFRSDTSGKYRGFKARYAAKVDMSGGDAGSKEAGGKNTRISAGHTQERVNEVTFTLGQ